MPSSAPQVRHLSVCGRVISARFRQFPPVVVSGFSPVLGNLGANFQLSNISRLLAVPSQPAQWEVFCQKFCQPGESFGRGL